MAPWNRIGRRVRRSETERRGIAVLEIAWHAQLTGATREMRRDSAPERQEARGNSGEKHLQTVRDEWGFSQISWRLARK